MVGRPIHATQTTLGKRCPFCGKAELVPVTFIKPTGVNGIVWTCPVCKYRRYPKMVKYVPRFRTRFKELSSLVESEAAIIRKARKKAGEVD